ncbi:hypothetical protein EVAR_26770_1 [Eumeta japonica]|uniref:Uncharacterized protein n=1 Tax=Eumeta variegata TaxID=151549 RepID=A0A4C1XD40_EUMVA|nr:hypothetical protein EVAR_26770_1 [Eumeta japonica]
MKIVNDAGENCGVSRERRSQIFLLPALFCSGNESREKWGIKVLLRARCVQKLFRERISLRVLEAVRRSADGAETSYLNRPCTSRTTARRRWEREGAPCEKNGKEKADTAGHITPPDPFIPRGAPSTSCADNGASLMNTTTIRLNIAAGPGPIRVPPSLGARLSALPAA